MGAPLKFFSLLEGNENVLLNFRDDELVFAEQPAEGEVEVFVGTNLRGLLQILTGELTSSVKSFPYFSGKFAGFFLEHV